MQCHFTLIFLLSFLCLLLHFRMNSLQLFIHPSTRNKRSWLLNLSIIWIPMILTSCAYWYVPNLFLILLNLPKIYLASIWLMQYMVIIISILDRYKSVLNDCDEDILNDIDKKHYECIEINLCKDYVYNLEVVKCIVNHIAIHHSEKCDHCTRWWAKSLRIPK